MKDNIIIDWYSQQQLNQTNRDYNKDHSHYANHSNNPGTQNQDHYDKNNSHASDNYDANDNKNNHNAHTATAPNPHWSSTSAAVINTPNLLYFISFN